MSLPTRPNRTTPTSIRQGDLGWPVFAVQGGLDELGFYCMADGVFGPATYRMIQAFQRKVQSLTIDGIAGPATQAQITRLIDVRVHESHPSLPAGLLRGFALSESGNALGAVNWNVSGGVDCGVMQIRCYGPPFSNDALRVAYDPTVAMDRVAVSFLDRTQRFVKLDSKRPVEWAMRCAALAWNWPWAAEQYAAKGKLPNPSLNATWAVVNGQRIKFPDGVPVLTYDDWARFYALGGEHGEGRVTRFVTEWV
jgi:hypothetical protein